MAENGAELGSGHISIFPVMSGFRSAVTKEMQASGSEGGSIFSKAFRGIGRRTGNELGRDMKSAFTGAAGDMASPGLKKLERDVATAAKSMTNARLKEQDAAGKVRVAEAQLNEAVSKGGADSARAVAATERLASAKRREQTTSETLTNAEKKLKDAKQAVNEVKQATIEAPKTGAFTSAVNRIRQAISGLDGQRLNRAEASVNGLGGTYSRVSDRIKASTVAIGNLLASGVRGIANYGRSAIDAYNQISGVTAKFQQIASNNHWAEAQTQQLLDLNTQLGKTGVISAGTLKATQAQLGTFKLSAQSVQTLTPAIADLIANQKGYNATVEDGTRMANLAGKVMTGNVGALSRYGVTLDDNQKKLLKNGDQEQRAAVLAQVLEENFGGVNEAMAKTPYGKYVVLQHQLAGIKTTIGSGFISAIGALGDKGIDVVDAVNGKLQGFFKWLPDAVGGVVNLLENGQVSDAFATAFHVPDSAREGIESTVSHIRNTCKGLVDFLRSGTFSKAFIDGFKGMDPKIVGNFEDALKKVRKQITGTTDDFRPFSNGFKGSGAGLSIASRGVQAVTLALNTLSPTISIVSNLVKAFASVPAPVQEAVGASLLLSKQLGGLSEPIGIVYKAITGLGKGIGAVSGKIGEFFSAKLFDATPIMNAEQELSGAGSAAEDMASKTTKAGEASENAGRKTQNAFGGISLKAVAAGTAVTATFGIVSNTLQHDKDLADSFSKAMQGGADSYQTFMQQMKTGDQGKYGILDKAGSLFKDSSVSDTLKRNGIGFQTFEKAVEGSGSAYQELQDKTPGVLTNMNAVTNAVDKLRGSYKDTIGKMVEYSKTQEAISAGTGSVQNAFSQLSTTLKANGDDLSQNGRLSDDSQKAIGRATDALWQNVQAQLQYGKTSGDMSTAIQGAKNSVQQMRDSLIQTLEQQGMSEQAAGQYADSLGLIPKNVGTKFTADTTLSKGQIEAYLDTLGLTPSQKKTVMTALTKEAHGNVSKLHETMDKLPKKVQSILTADDTDTKKKTDQAVTSMRKFNGTKAKGKLEADDSDVKKKTSGASASLQSFNGKHAKGSLTADNSDVLGKTGGARGTLDAFNGKTVGSSLRSNNSDVLGKTGGARSTLDAFNGKTVGSYIQGDNGNAIGAVNGANGALNGYNGRTASATVTANDQASGVIQGIIGWVKKIPNKISMFFEGHASGGPTGRAQGGIIQALASGGPSGWVRGPGTTTSDSIPTLLSDQEFVMRASSAKKIGIDRLQRMNATGKVDDGVKIVSQQPVVNQQINITNKGVSDPYVNGTLLGRSAAHAALHSFGR